MDPNKIHIDELVRQRLQGGEEEPRAGAWLSMRELLDKQMPAGRPLGGFAWGKATRWTAALVALTLAAGGYGAFEVRRAANQRVGQMKNLAVRSTPSTNASTSTNAHQSSSPSAFIAESEDMAVSSNEKVTSAFSTDDKRQTKSGLNADVSAHTVVRSRHNVDAAPVSRVRRKNLTASFSEDRRSIPTLQTSSLTVSSEATLASSHSSRRNSRSSAAKNAQAARSAASSIQAAAGDINSVASSTATDQQHTARTTPSARQGHGRRDAREVPKSAENLSASVRTESPRSLRNAANRGNRRGCVISDPDSAKAQVQRDTLRPIRIAHRYLSTRGVRGSGRYIADTLVSEPLIIEHPLPATAATQASAKSSRQRRPLLARKRSAPASTPVAVSAAPVGATVVKNTQGKSASGKASGTVSLSPAASEPLLVSAPPTLSAGVEMVPLSSKKVSSTTNAKLQYTAQEQIQDAVRRTQFLFGQMRLYSGVTGGFNASVGGTSMGGFHAGLFGLLAIDDHWSAGIEGKFFQRFNRGTELHDPYSQYRATTFDRFTNSAGNAYNVYRVTQDSFNHYYKLSTIETLEFPVYGRYSFRRFHTFAGVNVTYGLRVKNIERVDRFAGRASNPDMDTVLSSVQYAPPANTKASVNLEDFGPRFGLGYTAGMGYQASPAVLVDIRMTQLVWDNRSAGAGGLRVSQTYYRVPSLQLSIGYRFSQRSAHR